jgi:hypothetical protein
MRNALGQHVASSRLWRDYLWQAAIPAVHNPPAHRNDVKPSEKTRRAPAEMHAKAALRHDLATDRPLAANEIADFGAHP